MDAIDALRQIVDGSGKSRRAVSFELGKSENYLSSTIAQRGVPSCATLSSVARLCGYKLALVPLGDELPWGSVEID